MYIGGCIREEMLLIFPYAMITFFIYIPMNDVLGTIIINGKPSHIK